MNISALEPSVRKREYDSCSERMRDSVVYHYLFEGRSHRWLDEYVISEDPDVSRGYIAMGILHHLGLVNDHKGIFIGLEIMESITLFEESTASDFKEIKMALLRYYRDQHVNDRYESFVLSIDSPKIIKRVGNSQFTDGVRIEKRYHSILNPPGSKYFVKRGAARKIKVLFNNKIFDAEYRYEGQKNKEIELQSIRFRRELKNEFQKVFPDVRGEFSIEYGGDLNHFVFTPIFADKEYVDEGENDFAEGQIAYRNHKIRERNPKVVEKAKARFKQNHDGSIYCEVCGFDFSKVYGELGEGYIEGHHVIPVSELKEGDKTKVEDIAMLCANCHRMIHRNSGLSLEELSDMVELTV